MATATMTENVLETLGSGFVTVPDVAKFLRVSRAKVYVEMDAGRLPYAKFGKSRRIRVDDLKRYAEEAMVGA